MAKTALVTGSSKGIGRAIALNLAEAGYDVAVNYNSDEAGGLDTCEKIRAMGRRSIAIQANVAKLEDIEKLFREFFAEFPTIDVLVNNAGITRFCPFLEATPELFEQVISVDFRGSYFCAQAAARNMVEHGTQGVIINITSNHQIGHWPTANLYGPIKAALNKFTEHAAMELGKNGIRVISVAPGYTIIRDEQLRRQERGAKNPLAEKIPLNRFGTADEVGKMVAQLCSNPGAGYITGTCLYMDGGALLANVVETQIEPAVWPVTEEMKQAREEERARQRAAWKKAMEEEEAQLKQSEESKA